MINTDTNWYFQIHRTITVSLIRRYSTIPSVEAWRHACFDQKQREQTAKPENNVKISRQKMIVFKLLFIRLAI